MNTKVMKNEIVDKLIFQLEIACHMENSTIGYFLSPKKLHGRLTQRVSVYSITLKRPDKL